MTKRKTTSSPAVAGLDLTSPEAYEQALKDLDITVPVLQCRLLNNRLEFRLYGGRILYWPSTPAPVGAGPRARPQDPPTRPQEDEHAD